MTLTELVDSYRTARDRKYGSLIYKMLTEYTWVIRDPHDMIRSDEFDRIEYVLVMSGVFSASGFPVTPLTMTFLLRGSHLDLGIYTLKAVALDSELTKRLLDLTGLFDVLVTSGTLGAAASNQMNKRPLSDKRLESRHMGTLIFWKES